MLVLKSIAFLVFITNKYFLKYYRFLDQMNTNLWKLYFLKKNLNLTHVRLDSATI